MAKEYKPTIAVDFDGVIHSYTSGWKGAHNIPDPPVEGSIKYLTDLVQRADVDVVILSSRAKTWRGRRAIRQWLYDHAPNWYFPDAFYDGLKSIKVTAVKPAVVVYIDDRGHRFDGTFPSVEEVLTRKPWNK